MNFGLTETGFSLKRQPDILADLATALTARFGNDLNLAADSALGQLAGVFSQAAAEIWEAAADAWHAQYRSSAEDASLDALGDLINLPRRSGEPDADYRARMRLQPRSNARCTMDAVRNRLLAVDGVTAASVVSFEDVDTGSPPYPVPLNSFQVFVDGTDDDATNAAVAAAVWEMKPSGIPTAVLTENAGDNRAVLTPDSQGLLRSVLFSRPALIDIHLTVYLDGESAGSNLPSDWAARVTANILALGANYGLGQSVPAQKFYAAAFAVPGVNSIQLHIASSAHGETDPSLFDIPGDAVVSLAAFQKPYFDASLLTVEFGS